MGIFSAMSSGLLFENLASAIASLDAFPSCSLSNSIGVRGRFNSWSCADSQRDSAEQMSKISEILLPVPPNHPWAFPPVQT